MAIGDLNKKFGWLWLIIAPLMGMYIASMIRSRGADYSSVFDEVTIAGESLSLYMGEAFPRLVNRLIHAHSGLLAFLNIMYGLSIDEVPLTDRTKRIGSVLAVLGAIFVTFGFYLLPSVSMGAASFPLRMLGGISIAISLLIMLIGQLKK